MSIFQLTLCLRFRYLVYSFVTYIGSSILFVYLAQTANWDMPGFAFFPQITFAHMIGGTLFIITLYLQTEGIRRAKEFYNYNKVGKGRAARVLIRHRDVMQIDTSWKEQWKATKQYCFFFDVIPANLFGLGGLLGIFFYLTQGMGILPFAVAIGFFILGGLSINYAADHLCNVEIEELYSNPQTYDTAITHGKQEIIERASMQRTKEQIEKERKRNMPLPPESDKQRRPPRKPY
ncbi:hypothetical protein B1L04_03050 [Microcystis aeruginosa KW]|uniref:Uncharacterized protein n=1 Tax=Microcystis aeruginosa KW TaxID=1960155 RepID=A0A1V4BZ01_MICAE|nr:hypothetical protein [Microcystis aeruginosa]OPF19776.1 hypothetical protein B1L04_03050 [Microcystis aeruginosa KW]